MIPLARADAWHGLVHACLYEQTLPAFASGRLVHGRERVDQARYLVTVWSALAVRATLREGT